MQQPVSSNRWLSPDLLSLAEQRRTPVTPKPQPAANAEIVSLETLEQPQERRARTRPPARRQWILHIAAGLLLIGSAAFSYLAWSQPGAPAASRMGKSTLDPVLDPVLDPTIQQQIHALRRDNHRLQQRIADLREQLASP